MLMIGFTAVFLCGLLPAICIYAINREDFDPSIQALAILILAPFIVFLVRILRLNL